MKSKIAAAEPSRAVEDAADGLEIEPVGLHLLGQRDPGDVLLVVVARAAADDGRRQQATGLMGPDVANRHAGPLRELSDRHTALWLPCHLTSW